MPCITSALGNAGARMTIDHNGKTYEVSYLTYGVQCAFAQWLKAGALAHLAAFRELLPPEEYAAEVKALMRDVEAGKFSPSGELAQRAMQTRDGMLKLVSLLLGCDTEEAVGLLLERGEDVKTLLLLVMQESAPKGSAKND